jgi:hypothetical protein
VAKALLVLAFVAPPVLVDALRGRRNVPGAPPSMPEPVVDKVEVAA